MPRLRLMLISLIFACLTSASAQEAPLPEGAPPPAPETAPAPEPEESQVSEAPVSEASPEAASPFLRWMGGELAAPLQAMVEQQAAQQQALQNEVMVTRQQMSDAREELAGIRRELGELRETLDLLVREVMADLRAENELLRAQQAQTQTQRNTAERLQTMDETQLEATVRETFGAPPAPGEAPAELELTIVEEWGRTAEEIAELGANASTLKGIIGLVPAGAAYGDLEQLGRDLRQQYDNFENINIEVFDDLAAAEGFQNNQVRNPAHRVLTVSKHQSSGRDSIVVYHNGVPRDVN